MSDTAVPSKKQYAAPKLNKVPTEEAKALLVDQADQSDNVVEDLLNFLSGLSA